MDRDERPADVMQDLRDLQRDVVQAQGSSGRREALTTASAGWAMPNRSTPPAPADGGHLFPSGDVPYWINSSGVVTALITQPGGAVTDPTVEVFNAPPTYDPAHIQTLVDSVESLYNSYIELLNALRTHGSIT